MFVLAIIAYLAIGTLTVYLIERFDGALSTLNELGPIIVVYLLWPIVLVLYIPFSVADLAREQRNKKKKQ